ncbi:FxsA family protein [Oryzobacter terrae]|uniref:FxsA family protein n=1 Tax=Oryzobacter terrae TaxID=1620385 RepID=UPI00366BA880
MTRPGATPYAARARRPRRLRWVLLVLALLAVTELVVLVTVARTIGGWQTLLVLLVEAAVGAWVVRHEGSRAWRALREAFRSGRMPSREIADAVLVLVGGVLLVLPGFVTDVVGLLFILPFTRPVARIWLEAVIARRVVRTVGEWPGGSPSSPTVPPRPVRGDVVSGEVVDPTPEDGAGGR